MSMHHKFYIKQMNLELEVVQPIYVQKIRVFRHFARLTIEDVDIFHQDVSGFSCISITNIGHVTAIEDVDIFCQNISIFHSFKYY